MSDALLRLIAGAIALSLLAIFIYYIKVTVVIAFGCFLLFSACLVGSVITEVLKRR